MSRKRRPLITQFGTNAKEQGTAGFSPVSADMRKSYKTDGQAKEVLKKDGGGLIYRMPALQLFSVVDGKTSYSQTGWTSETDISKRIVLENDANPVIIARLREKHPQAAPTDEISNVNDTRRGEITNAASFRVLKKPAHWEDLVNSIALLRDYFFNGKPPEDIPVGVLLRYITYLTSLPIYLMNRGKEQQRVKPNDAMSVTLAGFVKVPIGFGTLGRHLQDHNIATVRKEEMYTLAYTTLRDPDGKDPRLLGRSLLYSHSGARRTCPAPEGTIDEAADVLFGQLGNPQQSSLLSADTYEPINLATLKKFAGLYLGYMYDGAMFESLTRPVTRKDDMHYLVSGYVPKLQNMQDQMNTVLDRNPALAPRVTVGGFAEFAGIRL